MLWGGTFDFDEKSKRLSEILETLNDPEIWEDLEKTQELNKERSRLEKTLSALDQLGSQLED